MLTIGELAKRTGVPTTTLRYYDERGLVQPVGREGGQRRYDRAAVRQVGVVLLLRDVGFTLTEIAQLLADFRLHESIWERRVRDKLAELDHLITTAETARTALVHALECPKRDPAICPTFWSIVDARLEGQSLADIHRH